MNDSVKASLDRLLLDLQTRATCPRCEHEFSLEEGFAKKALEQLEDASRWGIGWGSSSRYVRRRPDGRRRFRRSETRSADGRLTN